MKRMDATRVRAKDVIEKLPEATRRPCGQCMTLSLAIVALTQLLSLLVVALTPNMAWATNVPKTDSFYQFFRTDPSYIEDYVRVDTSAHVLDDTLYVQVNPYHDDFTLSGQDTHWRVMVNFAGGTPAGERDVTDVAGYDDATGILMLPAGYANEHVSFVAQIPWLHPAHDLVRHWSRGTTDKNAVSVGVRSSRSTALRAFSTASDITAGSVYPIKNVASNSTGSYKPVMLGCDFGTSNLATLCGYPEREGRYGFFVAFQKDNCELFELVDAVPGRLGGSGIVTTPYSSTPHNLRDNRWVYADCVEDVNNGRELFFIIEDAGSWVRIDAIDGATIHCTFRLSVNGPNGANYQDVMGKFDLEMPYGSIRIQKQSSRTSITDGNGCYSLAGATYGVYADAGCTQAVGALVTDADGIATLEELDASTYWVREDTPPNGYARDEETYVVTVRAGETTDVGEGGVFDRPLYATGKLTIQKGDADGTSTAQGDATLTGTRFEVAYYDGAYDNAQELPAEACRTWLVTTAMLDDGSIGASLGDVRCETHGDALYEDDGTTVLPLGTIAIREVGAPTGYLLSDGSTHLLRVVADGNEPGGAALRKVGTWDVGHAHVDGLDLAVNDQVARGGVRLGKVDMENGRHLAQGAATFEGAVMAIELVSNQAVVVDGIAYPTGSIVTTVTLGPDGIGSTNGNALPYGSYVAYELAAPNGYVATARNTWSREFAIRAEGELVDLTSEIDSVPDQVIRGDIDLTKVAEGSMERLGGVPFLITSDTTGEAHVIVTDANGYASTAASWHPHSQRTNANDEAVHRMGETWSIDDEAALSPSAGVWFGGRIDAAALPDDRLGALPFDTYTVTELRSKTNAGMAPVSFVVTVDRHGSTVACGTIVNRAAPSLGTTLTAADTGTHVAAAEGVVTLRDDVRYTSLEVGASYDIVGTLHVVAADGGDGGMLYDANGAPISATTSFVASQPDGVATVAFTFDASTLGGSSVVAFETLVRDGVVIASHEDADDAGQTVSFATIVTSLSDGGSGSKLVAAAGDATVIDAVQYQGLVPGTPYRLVGTLMDASTGLPAVSVNNEPLAGGVTFVPETSSGTVDVPFSFGATAQAGRSLVAYQTLFEGSTALVVHADINNESQTVSLPSISTSAVDGTTGTHEALAAADVVIIDTVSYENLAVGESYELVATLVLTGTDSSPSSGDEAPTTRAEFTAMDTSGSIDVAIPLDATKLAGCSVTVLERVYQDGRLIASHDDPNDAMQTVSFPAIATEAGDASTGGHRVAASDEAAITDTITYHNLTPGNEYVIVGTLHRRLDDGSDGGTVRDARGSEVTATTTFVPETSDGTTKVSFTVDTTKLAGETLVAFEQVRHGDSVVARHADIASDAQAVAVVTRSAGGSLPRTGDPTPNLLPVILVGAAALLFGRVGLSLAKTTRTSNDGRGRRPHRRASTSRTPMSRIRIQRGRSWLAGQQLTPAWNPPRQQLMVGTRGSVLRSRRDE